MDSIAEKKKAQNKKWYTNHRGQIKEYKKKVREHENEMRRKRHQADPNYNRIICNRRRTRIAHSSGCHTVVEWKTLLDKYGGKCLKCGSVENITEDHVLPLSKGGSNDIKNIQPLCLSCNSGKGDTYTDYRPEAYQISLDELIALGARGDIYVSARALKGEKNPKAKLTEQDIIDISNSDEPTGVLCERYKVGHTVMNEIRAGKSWKHIPRRIRIAGKGRRTNYIFVNKKQPLP